MTTAQHTTNRSETSVDDRTQLLAPVGRGQDATQILTRYSRAADETAVIPKAAPAQPQPITSGEPYNDHPWCRKKATAMGILFGAGVAVGVPLGVVGTVIALVWKVAA